VPRHRLVEPQEARRGVGFWLAAAGLVFVIVLVAGAFSFGEVPLQVTGSLLVSGVVLVAATVNAMKTWTRQIDVNDDGVVDRDFFTTRQVPWQAIKSMRLVDVNQSAQEQFELSARHAGTGTIGRIRPRAMKFWSFSAASCVWLAEEVQGRVVEKPEGALPSPVVSYRLPNGQTLLLQNDGDVRHAQTPLGASVRVCFDPQRPHDGRPRPHLLVPDTQAPRLFRRFHAKGVSCRNGRALLQATRHPPQRKGQQRHHERQPTVHAHRLRLVNHEPIEVVALVVVGQPRCLHEQRRAAQRAQAQRCGHQPQQPF